ncbi:MAG: glutathione peroxidase [Winogradskyella sp.]|uniref:glutathione peroxidase n=1 Tax=Winogradskyella sp. TaxID=1883156 RepID=UPI0025F070EE|nr:glutathione peroxidase [Winogradskyella sp.]NRB84017.1 glutathione peroxidase [Winogradskyella sp.]
MNPIKAFVGTLSTTDKHIVNTAKESIYDIEINSLKGDAVMLNDYKGKYILFVNVASKCGFTPQYRELQQLFEKYNDKLVVIGIPCNQFGRQEPGNAKDIEEFCELNYGVSFLITEKIDVKGSNQHPLYKWLTTKALNGKQNSTVKWNFQKYLVDKDGEFLDYFFSITKPTNSRITKYIQ